MLRALCLLTDRPWHLRSTSAWHAFSEMQCAGRCLTAKCALRVVLSTASGAARAQHQDKSNAMLQHPQANRRSREEAAERWVTAGYLVTNFFIPLDMPAWMRYFLYTPSTCQAASWCSMPLKV